MLKPFIIASQHLAHLKKSRTYMNRFDSDHPDSVGRCTNVFWWDDVTPLYEYEFLTVEGRPAGYVIVSTASRLPPVLAFSSAGETLSTSLSAYLASASLGTKEPCFNVTWYFISPIEIVASVTVPSTRNRRLLLLPELYTVDVPRSMTILRPGRASRQIAQYWRIAEGKSRRKFRSIVKELPHLQPIAYQQNCRADRGQTDSGHYCDPDCIAGCVPVAWAMFASSRKKSSAGGGQSAIWPGSTCWNVNWPSSAGPNNDPSQCSAVSDSIWGLHDTMRTTCDGTTDRNAWSNAHAFFRTEWGRDWRWTTQVNPTFDYCNHRLHEDHTFVFAGRGEWTDHLYRCIAGKTQGLEVLGKVAILHSMAQGGTIFVRN